MKNYLIPLLLLVCMNGFSQNSELTVIGNNNGVPSNLDFANLQSVFKGNQAKWTNGDKVVIAVMKLTTNAGKSTCSKLYMMSPADVTKLWVTVSIKGIIDPPVLFNTAGELQTFVSNTRGAIGIMDAAVKAPNTKTVLIGGKGTF